MSKSTRQIVILCAVLVILIGGYFGIGAYKKHQAQAALDAQIHIGDLDDLVDVSYTLSGETLSFYRDGKVWRCSTEPERPLDSTHFSKIATYIVGLTAAKTIEVTDTLHAYGLDDPCIFKATDEKGHSVTLLLGGPAGDGVNCYAQFPGNDTIYLINNSLLWYTGKTLDYMTSVDDIPEIPDENLVGFSITTADGNVVVAPGDQKGYDDNGNIIYYWWASYNGSEPVLLDDPGELTVLEARAMIKNTMWFSSCIDYKVEDAELKDYGLDKPSIVVDARWRDVYSGEETDYILLFGDRIGDEAYYYSKLSDSAAVNSFRELGYDQFTKTVLDVADYFAKLDK